MSFQGQGVSRLNEPLQFWAKVMLRLAIVLLAVGLVPLLVLQLLLTQMDPIVPVLLSVMVAPLGVVCLVVAVILFLVVLAQRRRGSS
jgi:polyferredoxin